MTAQNDIRLTHALDHDHPDIVLFASGASGESVARLLVRISWAVISYWAALVRSSRRGRRAFRVMFSLPRARGWRYFVHDAERAWLRIASDTPEHIIDIMREYGYREVDRRTYYAARQKWLKEEK